MQDQFIENLGHGPDRFQVKLKMPEAAVFFTHAFNQNVTMAIQEVETLVQTFNEMWRNRISKWVDEGMENCRGTMRYKRITCKKPHITPRNRLLDPYYSVLDNE